jgi:large subunit ribosomal protein L35
MPSRSASQSVYYRRHDLRIEKGFEMPKLKNKSAARKRFHFTGTGKIRGNVACKRHNLRKRSQKMKRQARGTFILPPEAHIVAAKYFPHI